MNETKGWEFLKVLKLGENAVLSRLIFFNIFLNLTLNIDI